MSESVRKLFKQIQRLYERDTRFQQQLDRLIENSQIKSGQVEEKRDSFSLNLLCSKYEPDQSPPPIKETTKPIAIKPIISPIIKEITPPPKPPTPPPPQPKPIEQTQTKPKPPPPPPPKKESEEPAVYVEEEQVTLKEYLFILGT